MSVQAITCALAARGVSPSEKLVLLALSNYADEHMQCWPSQQRLADDCCMSERGIRKILAELESRKVLSREPRRRDDGYRASDKFTLHFLGTVTAEAEIILPELRSPEQISAEPRSPERQTDLTGTEVQFLPAPGAGLTTLEPSEEPSVEPSLSAQGRARRKATRRVPEDWSPGPSVIRVGAEVGLTAGELERELARMRDHEYRSGHSDWDAAARNWLRTAAERRPRERPDKLTAKQANYARAFAGAEDAARRVAKLR